jgi:hypothetical protein
MVNAEVQSCLFNMVGAVHPFFFFGQIFEVPKISDFGLLLLPDSGDLDYIYSSFLQ